MSGYREAGVDQQAADSLVPVFARLAARASRPEVLGEVGGFSGLFSLEGLAERGYRRPALVVSTDGVGTKVELLRRAGLHRVAGWDAVAMNADDVACAGAEPLLFVDYVSIERLDVTVMEEIVSGVADACAEAGCALVGGETSQHPGLMPPGSYEVVGTCVGVVDAGRTWGAHRVRPGDAIVGLSSSGPHANGFSLVRTILGDDVPPEGLLAPTAIYAAKLAALREKADVHAAAHVTGGGIAGNLARVLPPGAGAVIDTAAWPRPEVFDWIASRGVGEGDMWATFNMGLGMLVLTAEPAAALSVVGDARVVGEVRAEPGIVLA